jgi:hypothetical protein
VILSDACVAVEAARPCGYACGVCRSPRLSAYALVCCLFIPMPRPAHRLAFPPLRRSPSLTPAAAHRGLPTSPHGRARRRRRRRGSPRLRHRRGEGNRRAGRARLGGAGGRVAPGSWGGRRSGLQAWGLGPGDMGPGFLGDRRMRQGPRVREDSAVEAEELRAPRVGLARGCSADMYHPRPPPGLLHPAVPGRIAAELAAAQFFRMEIRDILLRPVCFRRRDFLSR